MTTTIIIIIIIIKMATMTNVTVIIINKYNHLSITFKKKLCVSLRTCIYMLTKQWSVIDDDDDDGDGMSIRYKSHRR